MPLMSPVWYPINGALPAQAGVYMIVDRDNQPIYIGETDDFDRRIKEHRSDRTHKMHQYAPYGVYIELQGIEEVRLQRRATLIDEYRPLVSS